MFKNKFLIIFTVFLFSFVIFYMSHASITNGTIDETNKYAYSENMGWINFGDTNSTVHITDTELTGYAYGENIGWISLNCSNDNTCSNNNYKVSNTTNGVLSGYAYGENIGWVNFSGVTINSSGEFTGYAYNENTGYISFNCSNTDTCSTNNYKVTTDWRPFSQRPQCNNQIDDDGDGRVDYPSDTGCTSLDDNNETNPSSGGVIIFPPTNNNNQEQNNNQQSTNNTSTQISGVGSYSNGSFVKSNIISTVYFVVEQNRTRHIYPSEAIWYSYFGKDFSNVSTLYNSQNMSDYALGRNVVFKRGTLFKVPSVPKVYLVGDNGQVKWVKTETKAIELYGNNWNKLVYDLDESLFSDYIENGIIE